MTEEMPINQTESLLYSDNLNCPIFTNRDASVLTELKFWVGGIVNCVIAVLGMLINVVSAYVLLTNQVLKNTFNRMLGILLIIDSICLFFIISDVFHNIFHLFPQMYDIFIPHFFPPFRNISLTASIFMTIVISHERYEAVQRPLSHRHRSSRSLLIRGTSIAIICAIIINSPKFFEAEVEWTWAQSLEIFGEI